MVVQKASSPAVMFGLKVSNISSAIGWGAQGGTCSLTLVDEGQDPSHTDFDADPIAGVPQPPGGGAVVSGFPAAGTACIFNFRAFSFGGVLQRETYKESQGGRLYDLVLESPSKLLDGSQVILSDFEAGWNEAGQKNYLNYEVKNVWNAFALYENPEYGGGDQSVAAGGNGGFFGNSGVNEGGMLVTKLFPALKWFGSNGTKFPDGTEISEDSENYVKPFFGGKLVYGESEYTIDFSELEEIILARVPYYRVKGPVQSINSIISDLCEVAQLDYFIQVVDPDQLTDDEGNPLNGVIKNPELKVRITDKSVVESGIIEGYIDEFKKTGVVVSSNVGTELQDAPTGKVLIGGPASRTLTRSIRFSPFAFNVIDTFSSGGKQFYSIGNNMTQSYNDPHEIIPVRLDIPAYLPFSMGGITDPRLSQLVLKSTYKATALEIRLWLNEDTAAAEFAWSRYKAFQIGAGMEPNGFVPNNWWGTFANPKALWQMNNGNPKYGYDGYLQKGNNWVPFEGGNVGLSADPSKTPVTSQKSITTALKRVAQEVYGKLFMVPLPAEPGGLNNNLRWVDPEFETNVEESWQISDSSWPQDGRPILDSRFYDSSGKLRSYCAWDGSAWATYASLAGEISLLPNIDFSSLGQDWGTDIGGFTAAMKGGPNKDIYWIGDNPYAIIDTGVQIRQWDSLTQEIYGEDIFSQVFFRHPPESRFSGPLSILPGIFARNSTLGGAVECAIPPGVLPPDYAIVPQESTRYSWGPWYAWSDAANGKSEVEVDTTMKPETFGSVEAMDQVGFGSVFSGLARIEAIETGTVELAKEPDFNLGDRFAASGPYITNLDISASTGGIKTNYKFSTFTPNFGKLSKYNADRIARINKKSIEFAKENERPNQPFPKHSFGFGKNNTVAVRPSISNNQGMAGNAAQGVNAPNAAGGPNNPAEAQGAGG